MNGRAMETSKISPDKLGSNPYVANYDFLFHSATILRIYTKGRDLDGQYKMALAVSATEASSCYGLNSDRRSY